MRSITGFLRSHLKMSIATALAAALIFVFAMRNGTATLAETIVTRGDIEQVVLATGKTKAADNVELGFERSGKVVSAPVSVGSRVSAGETLAVLDQSELRANLARAEAALAEAEANLTESSRTSTSNYGTARDKALIALTDAYTRSIDAVYNTADRFFVNPGAGAPTFKVTYFSGGNTYEFYVDDSLSRMLSNRRAELDPLFVSWKASLDAARNGGDIDARFAEADRNVTAIKNFLTLVSTGINSIKSYDQAYESIVAGYKSAILSARSDVNATQSDLLAAREKYGNAPQETGSGQYDSVVGLEARVKAAQADVAAYQAQLDKTVLTAPISGIVTKQDAKRGQIVTAGASLISIISDQDIEIEANVSEVNIGKVNVGNTVVVTFDAFPDVSIAGRVTYIDPGEKIIDGVVNYKVTVQFTEKLPDGVKNGLTANLRIETEKHAGVLKIPSYAVEKKDEGSYVTVKSGERSESRRIETGLTGVDGTVEVVSGLSEGESVLIPKAK